MTVHFVVDQAEGRQAPACHPEGLPEMSPTDGWTHSPERVTCTECLAVLTGDAGEMASEGDGAGT